MTALLNRNFVLLWQAQAVSQSGNQAFAIATAFWMMEATGSATMTGLVIGAGILPGVILGPLAGAYVDRHGRRLQTVIACDVVSGVTMLVLAAAFLLAPGTWHAAMMVAAALVVGISAAVFEPALQSLVPDLVPADRLAQASALRQSTRQVVALAAQGVGGLLYALMGPVPLLLLNGVSFLFAGATERLIRVPQAPSGRPAPSTPSKLLADARAGWSYLNSHRRLASILWTAAIFNALLMPVTVLLPVYSTVQLGAGVRWYGLLLSAITAGALGASLLLSTRRDAGDRTPVLMAAFGLMAVLIVGLGQVRSGGLALAILFVMGVCVATVNVLVQAILQRWTAPAFRARVSALHVTLTRALTPVGLVGGGMAADFVGRDIPLVYGLCGGLALLSVICATVSSRWTPRHASAPLAGASSCSPAWAAHSSSTTS